MIATLKKWKRERGRGMPRDYLSQSLRDWWSVGCRWRLGLWRRSTPLKSWMRGTWNWCLARTSWLNPVGPSTIPQDQLSAAEFCFIEETSQADQRNKVFQVNLQKDICGKRTNDDISRDSVRIKISVLFEYDTWHGNYKLKCHLKKSLLRWQMSHECSFRTRLDVDGVWLKGELCGGYMPGTLWLNQAGLSCN